MFLVEHSEEVEILKIAKNYAKKKTIDHLIKMSTQTIHPEAKRTGAGIYLQHCLLSDACLNIMKGSALAVINSSLPFPSRFQPTEEECVTAVSRGDIYFVSCCSAGLKG